MKILSLHSWDVSYSEARAIQESLRHKVKSGSLQKRLRFVAGADVSYEKHGDIFFAGVLVWDMKTGEVVEERGAVGRVTFPYIPGLLSFREAPVLLEAFRGVESRVDAVIVDGQGLAHPRGFGLASHICLLLNKSGAGCAKSLLVGEHDTVGSRKGDRAALMFDGCCVGTALRTRDGVKPVFVSPGHRLSVEAAAELVLRCSIKYRQPEPTRLAHGFVNRIRREKLSGH